MTTKPGNTNKKHILIVKHGALGDVVRTSYFAGALRRKYGHELRLSWMTAPPSFPLLRYNPSIDDIWTDFSSCGNLAFDHVYSLDDEREIVEQIAGLRAGTVTGAIVKPSGELGYSEDAAAWFDMGLLSRYGKTQADRLKVANARSYSEIFSEIFDVISPQPEFWGLDLYKEEARQWRGRVSVMIGINPYGGGRRWPSKELPQKALIELIGYLLDVLPPDPDAKVALLGSGAHRRRNLEIINQLDDQRLVAPDTDDSPLRLAAIISQLDYLVTSDTLALHLGIAQRRPFTAFFAPTSAAEIDTFGLGMKLRSTAPDYCSYRNDADNSTITARRIFAEMVKHRPDLFLDDAASESVQLKVAG